MGRGQLVVLPTDTVYGVGCDAFKPDAVKALLDAKGRGREMPPPVLVGSARAAEALVEDLGSYGADLIDEFWPGALTIICKASSTLAWDLGDTKGTVAVRMPLHPLALELLKRTGPMAVSSANVSGGAPARTAKDAEAQLGDSVEIYLDDGATGDDLPSSIVDLTGTVPRLLRAGAISDTRLREVCGVLITEDDIAAAEAESATDAPADGAPTPEADHKPEAEDAPTPEADEAPEPEAKDAPKPEPKDAPAPKAKDAPEPEVKDAPKPEAKDVGKPEPDGTGAGNEADKDV